MTVGMNIVCIAVALVKEDVSASVQIKECVVLGGV